MAGRTTWRLGTRVLLQCVLHNSPLFCNFQGLKRGEKPRVSQAPASRHPEPLGSVPLPRVRWAARGPAGVPSPFCLCCPPRVPSCCPPQQLTEQGGGRFHASCIHKAGRAGLSITLPAPRRSVPSLQLPASPDGEPAPGSEPLLCPQTLLEERTGTVPGRESLAGDVTDGLERAGGDVAAGGGV